MSRILENLKAGDPVIVVSTGIGPDGLRRTERKIERVTKVFAHVLQTESMTGVQIATGRTPWTYGGKAVEPASLQDVADVLREIEDRKLADAEYKLRQQAEYADRCRREKLAVDIRDIVMYRHVPESVLVRVLAVLRGDA